MSKQTKIIAAFPAMGKTSFTEKCRDDGRYACSDSDSSVFSWINDNEGNRVRNPYFVEDYIDHIHDLYNSGMYDFIFVSTHKDIIAALVKEKFEFTVLYPRKEDKDLILQRCKNRGSPEGLIKVIDENYDIFLDDISKASINEKGELQFIPISTNQFVEDYIELMEEGFTCTPKSQYKPTTEPFKFSCTRYGEQ